MKTLQFIKKFSVSLFMSSYLMLGTMPAAADDIDIYFGIDATDQEFIPNILFIIDTSGSMNQLDGTDSTRLQKVQNALKSVLEEKGDGINVGLMRFSVPGGPILYPITNTGAAYEGDFNVNGAIARDDDDGKEFDSDNRVDLDNNNIQIESGRLIGLRFDDMAIPQGATITSARLRLFARYDDTAETEISINGELDEDSSGFDEVSSNLSGRAKTSASVTWNTSGWVRDEASSSADVSSIVQEIVNQTDWCGGNDLSMFLRYASGSEGKYFHAFNGSADKAARLEISFANDGNVNGCYRHTSYAQLGDQKNNVEQAASNNMNNTGNVLNVDTGSNTAIGLRFENVLVPANANITYAELIVNPREENSGTAQIAIAGEASSNAAEFDLANINPVTSRTTTSAGVTWNPGNWNSNGQSVRKYSPDIKAIIQEIVNLGGWQSGNALGIRLTPVSGSRRITSVKGNDGHWSRIPPRLRIQYKAPFDPTTLGTRQQLNAIIDSLHPQGGTPIQDTMYEAYQYYNGKSVKWGLDRGDSGDVKQWTRVSHRNSYTGADSILPSGCSSFDLSDSDCKEEYIPNTSGTPTYISPVSDVCQANYVVLLSDGLANNNNSESLVEAVTGTDCSGSGCAEDLAYYNFNKKASGSTDKKIKTYTISYEGDVDLSYLRSIASKGGGSFFSTSNTAGLVEAFGTIIREAKETNTSFVAPAASPSTSNQLQHNSEVYFALFSPDNRIDWRGNLKKYKIKDQLVVGKDDAYAVDTSTGEFESSVSDLWGTATTNNNRVEVGGSANLLPSSREIYSDLDGWSDIAADTSVMTKEAFGKPSASDDEHAAYKNWVLGKDQDGTERYHMGDPLHSNPVVVNYGTDPYVFFGTNHGYLHAINTNTGEEDWAFMPKAFVENVPTLYDNPASFNRVYGVDGPLVVKKVGEKLMLYVGMRRGGEEIYALDISSAGSPSLAFKIAPETDSPLSKLGQSWSKPVITKVNIDGAEKKVMIVGGGYALAQDDKATRAADAVGNAVFMFDAADGTLLWYASSSKAPGSENVGYTEISEMDYSIPARIAVVDRNKDGLADHMYVADMGAQLFRLDIDNGATKSKLVTGGRLADLGGSTEATARRFYYAPEVSRITEADGTYYAVAVGSGFRADPLNETIQDSFYVVRDWGVFTPSVDFDEDNKITYGLNDRSRSDLYDATSHALTSGTPLTTTEITQYKKGYYVDLEATGEKALSSPLITNGNVMFTTYSPEVTTTSGCTPAAGTARSYLMALTTGNALADFNVTGDLDKNDRTAKLITTGMPPPPKTTFQPEPVVCVGLQCGEAIVDPDKLVDENNDPTPCTTAECQWMYLFGDGNRVLRGSNWTTETERPSS